MTALQNSKKSAHLFGSRIGPFPLRGRKKVYGAFYALFLALSGCVEYVPYPRPEANKVPEITNVLLKLVDAQEKFKVDPNDYESTSLRTLITLGTPAGYRLKLRYTELGVPLVEALKTSRDRALLERLFELAKWSNNPEVRAESLVTLGSFADPKDLAFFRQAFQEKEVELKLAAIEAAQVSRQPGARGLIRDGMKDTSSPILLVFSAQAALSMGDEKGRAVLKESLKDNSWLVRAMAARYMGDYGGPDEQDLLWKAFQSETRNDFVTAEIAVALLKILSKQGRQVSYRPIAKGWVDSEEAAYTVSEDNVIEMEPLIIVPPRVVIPKEVQIAETINNRLRTLIRTRLDKPLSPVDQNDPNLETLFKLLTPTGFALQTRYSELSVLIVEGLGGTTNDLLRSELTSFVREDRNPLVRASALLSLAYAGLERDLIYIQEGLNDSDPVVRFGAMEAILVGRFKQAIPSVSTIAADDPIPAFRLFAMRILAAFGELSGRDNFLANLDNPDWPSRAMAYWYLGRYGSTDDYQLVFSRLNTETNPFVQTEIALAAVRLAPLHEK